MISWKGNCLDRPCREVHHLGKAQDHQTTTAAGRRKIREGLAPIFRALVSYVVRVVCKRSLVYQMSRMDLTTDANVHRFPGWSASCCSELSPAMSYIMDNILERYERYSYAERAIFSNEVEPQVDWCLEYSKLKARVDSLQKSQRHLMGEQLDSLSIKGLQHLEQQLEGSLKHIRLRKNQILLNSIAELQEKEKIWRDQNKTLEKEIMAKEKAKSSIHITSWEQQNQVLYSSSPPQALISDPAPTPTTLNYQGRGEEAGGEPQLRLGNSLLPPWMLNHLNG